MKRLRGKLTYSNVLVTVLAVLVIGGGTAYAATEMLPKGSVGTKQIKKEAVTPSKLSKASKAALTGPPGAKGATGATGATGPKGDKGDRGEAAPYLETLPSGKTERGIYGIAGHRTGYFPGATVSFPVPLATDPTAKKLAPGAPSTIECPGSVTQPEAAPGFLCIYAEAEAVPLDFFNVGAGFRNGFFYLMDAAEDADAENYGAWAVTAP
jgi:hypothetical protein